VAAHLAKLRWKPAEILEEHGWAFAEVALRPAPAVKAPVFGSGHQVVDAMAEFW